MGTHQKSIVKEMVERLDSLMALEESRGQAKNAARSEGETTWAFTTGKIHSYKSRTVYQEHAIRFVLWARTIYGLRQLSAIEERAAELTGEYLQARVDEEKSPSTLPVIRSALRIALKNRTLMNDIVLPKRTRASITRSRGPKAHDRHFQPAHWEHLLTFLKATGLRRDEVKMLRAQDIIERDSDLSSHTYGRMIVWVRNGKGGKSRCVPVLTGYEQEVLAFKKGLADEDRVFLRIPKHLDVHAYRRGYAQDLYLYYASDRSLPPTEGRLKSSDYDREAAYQVTLALGHNRIDVVLRHYIR